MEINKRIECFKTQLNYINDKAIKRLAELLIENADDYFFIVPASSSGKYHPDFARKQGGLVLHTKAVTDILHILVEEQELFKLQSVARDMLYCAAIAHDIKKQGDGSKGHTVNEHPILAGNYIINTYTSNKKELEELGLKYEQVNKIISLVKTHMGKWMAKFKIPVPETLGQYLLCTADVMASRKEWNQLFQNEPVIIQEMMQTEVHENKKGKKL